MKKASIADIRREYDAPGASGKPRFKPFALSQYWFQQALRALTVVRREFSPHGLTEQASPADPIKLFHDWFQQALRAKVLDPNAMTLATVGASGRPSLRTVLLKGFDAKGFVFFTNYQSQKGRELGLHPHASILFLWPNLMRQVRLDGKVHRVTAAESDEYFHSRPRLSQLSAWASRQSRAVKNREELEKRMRELEAQYQGKTVPRPPHWGGYRLVPDRIEFWSGRPNRLHDRLVYSRKGRGWGRVRLAP